MVRLRSVVGLAAGLGWQRESDLVTLGLSNDGLHLVNSVAGVLELGNVEASPLNLVLALDLSDLNGLGHTHLLGGGVGEGAGHLKGSLDKRNLVGLGLVLLMAHLVFSLAISMVSITISSWSTGSDLHGLRLLLIGDLGGGAGGGHILLLIDIGADLSVDSGGGLLADSEDSVKAVVIVNYLLDSQSDWSHLVSEGGDTDLSVDRGVGVSAVELWGIPIGGGVAIAGVSGGSCHGHCEQDQDLKHVRFIYWYA